MELKKYFSASPLLSTIRRIVLRIRHEKLPDWKTTPNCGSFFKNPVMSFLCGTQLLKDHPNALHWQQTNGEIKFSAAWLIEHSGLRNRRWGKIRISPMHALVLINEGENNHRYLVQAIDEIKKVVQNNFGVMLETEPDLLTTDFAKIFAKKQFL